eukprot:7342980-Pyramimonas_sp.AAC.1
MTPSPREVSRARVCAGGGLKPWRVSTTYEIEPDIGGGLSHGLAIREGDATVTGGRITRANNVSYQRHGEVLH